MISVKDRVPLYPGRVQLTPIVGQANKYDLTRADEPTEPGSPLNRRTMQLLQADIRTLPIATGQTIAAGDVVNIVSGAVTKTGTPSQAIALQAGTAGQPIDIIYDGVAELPGITAGAQITSLGVKGYAPQGGWIWVKPSWDVTPFVTGTYTGNDAATRAINLGFRPKAVIVAFGEGGFLDASMGTPYPAGGIAIDGFPAMRTPSDYVAYPIVSIVDAGFEVYFNDTNKVYSNRLVTRNKPYRYIALR